MKKPKRPSATGYATLADAREAVEHLIHHIREHSEHVKGRARGELNQEATVIKRWRAWLSERDELRGATEAELVQMLSEIACAGYHSLAILGAFLARNEEEWG